MREFIQNLSEAFMSSLEPFQRNAVYLDESRLVAGYEFNDVLAEAICASACWVLVYTPTYARQEYCLREFQAMCLLEARRRETLGEKLPHGHGMIIPVVLRGSEKDIPSLLRNARHYLDFRGYTTASPRIVRNEEYVNKIDRTAEYIAELFQLGDYVTDDCATFMMPGVPEVNPFAEPAQPFPGRIER